MKLIDLVIKELVNTGYLSVQDMKTMKFIAQDEDGSFLAFYEKPVFEDGQWWTNGQYTNLGVSEVIADNFSRDFVHVEDLLKPLTKETPITAQKVLKWDPETSFPPLGQKVSFWYQSNDREDGTYREGVVVYSSDKGATVDIGFLVSSGEKGDFDYSKKELAIEELSQEISEVFNLEKDNVLVRTFSEAVIEGKFPSISYKVKGDL